jgi:Zn-dependent membrane protease YugP
MFSLGGYGLYLLISLPALLLGLWAQLKVQSSFRKYSQVRSYTGATGMQVARHILDENGLSDVQIQQVGGTLSDHYDPRSKVLRLSASVYGSNSLAAVGVAAHESGHALQDKAGYSPMRIRSIMVPSVQVGSWLGPIIFMLGLFMSSATGDTIATVGLVLFAATAVFSLITLPVELDASRRAKTWLITSGALLESEISGVNAVLDAAAWTYVAAAIQAISTVLYYALLLFGGGRRRR